VHCDEEMWVNHIANRCRIRTMDEPRLLEQLGRVLRSTDGREATAKRIAEPIRRMCPSSRLVRVVIVILALACSPITSFFPEAQHA
jgi:hypothetical protein